MKHNNFNNVDFITWLYSIAVIIFIALKIFKIIECSWLWVLSPIWIPYALVILIILVTGIFYFIKK